MYHKSSRYAVQRNNFTKSYSSKGRTVRKKGGRKQYIDPRRFVKAAKQITGTTTFVPKNRFDDFNIHQLLKDNIIKMGFTLPTSIQDEAVPFGLDNKDVIGIADTGTGKTAAFAIPILNKLIQNPAAKALIVAPTRELAQQIEDECHSIAKGSSLYGALLIGGSSMQEQLRELRFNPSIVFGTPGRIKDHVQRGTLNLSKFNIIVLDEVDRMVDMGFIVDIRFLLGKLAQERQSYFFSATLDPSLEELVQSFLNNPVTVSVKTAETSDNVHQDVMRYNTAKDKIEKLHDTLLQDTTKKALIFDETQRSVERLSIELKARGFKADAIHAGKSQGQRQKALSRFKKNEINVLVATDVASRGIDVIDITHVINYTIPQTYNDYIHRVGRAGRAGRVGQALTFVNH